MALNIRDVDESYLSAKRAVDEWYAQFLMEWSLPEIQTMIGIGVSMLPDEAAKMLDPEAIMRVMERR